MTLNILFITITIKRRKITGQEVFREQMLDAILEEAKQKVYHHMYL